MSHPDRFGRVPNGMVETAYATDKREREEEREPTFFEELAADLARVQWEAIREMKGDEDGN